MSHQLVNARGRVHGVRAGQLVHRDNGARFAVQSAYKAVILRAQLDAGHILHAHGAAIGCFPDYDLSELFRRSQTTLGQDRISEFLFRGRRLAASLSGRVYCVLGLDGADYFRDGDAKLCQLVGLHPEAHRVLTRPKDLDLADARRTREWIAKVDVGIVSKKTRVVGTVWRVQADQHKRRGC